MPNLTISLNPRQRGIIYALLNTEGRITLSTLAKKTGLTPRIIRYNLDLLKAWFRNEGAALVARPGVGFEIDTPKQNRRRLLVQVSEGNESILVLTRLQRQRAALFDLLDADTPVTYHNLAAQGGISRSTIIHDMNEMQSWLNIYNLTLRRLPNRGTQIIGSELSRRFALLNVLREELGEEKWYSLWYNPDLKLIADKSIPLRIEKFLLSLPFDLYRNSVEHIENLMEKRLALYSRVEVMVYLALMVQSLQRGKAQKEPIQFEERDSIEFQVAGFILKEIARKISFDLPANEAEMLAAGLLGAKWGENELKFSPSSKPDLPGGAALKYANSIVSVCSSQLHPLLKVDEELLYGLARHLQPVIYRVKYNLPILNPCLGDILESYPEVFRSAKLGVAGMERDLGVSIPPEEVAYIAMYLSAALNRLRIRDRSKYPLVILGDGIRAKTSLLKARLEYEFPNLETIGVLNGYFPDDKILNQAELIISLIPAEIPGKTTLTLEPFLNPKDKKLVQGWLSEREKKDQGILADPGNKPDLVDLLLPQNIIFNQTEDDWRQVVHKASQPLLKTGQISTNYIQAMQKIIEDHGPYMILAPGVILLHARPVDGVNSLCLSLLILRQPVSFGKSPFEEVDIAFVLGAYDDHAHLNALFRLSNLIGQPEFLDALRKSSRASDVLMAIWTYSTYQPA